MSDNITEGMHRRCLSKSITKGRIIKTESFRMTAKFIKSPGWKTTDTGVTHIKVLILPF